MSVTLADVTSSEPGVLSVGDVQNDRFTLHAGTPGTSRVTANTAALKDAVDLNVEAIASSKLYVPQDIGHGFAMVPGAKITFGLFHFDGVGNELTGFGAVPVEVTPADALVPRQDSDWFDLVAPSASGTTIDLQAGTLQYSVPVVDPVSVASISW